VRRKEAGDGGRAANAKRAAAAAARAAQNAGKPAAPRGDDEEAGPGYNPYKIYRKLVNENKAAAYFWVFAYLGSNAITFGVTLDKWVAIVAANSAKLLDGTLDTVCDQLTDVCVIDAAACELNKVMVVSGPISAWGPYAKACGMCLNFNCSLIIYPVVRLLLRRLNNAGVSFNNRYGGERSERSPASH
jgi:hypothetical protein